jgi:hypothetical protein
VRLARLFHLASALFLLATSTAARADQQELFDDLFSAWSGPKGLETLRHLASCTSKRFPQTAQAFIRSDGDPEFFAKNQKTLMNNKCIKMYFFKNSITHVGPHIYAPILAEYLLLQDYDITGLPDISGVPPFEHLEVPKVEGLDPRLEELFAAQEIANDLERTAECVARADPQAVFHLAQAKPASLNESTHLTGLQGNLANCGAGKLPVSVPQFVWRGLIVAKLYRLVDAARPVTYDEVTPDA